MGVSGIILAGGRSTRMGRDKSLLSFNNETFIERNVKKLHSFVDEIIIASNHIAKYQIPELLEVPDVYPNMGPLAGLHAGLLAAKFEYAFVVPCDLPFFTKALALYLLQRRKGYDVIVPKIHEQWQPLCAVYAKTCIEPIENCLQAGITKVYRFYPQVKVLSVNEAELKAIGNVEDLFYNMNTPEDFTLLGKESN